MLETITNSPNRPCFSQLTNVSGELKAHRYKAYSRQTSNADRLKALGGAIVGTAVPMILFAKKQKIKNPFKLNYGIKEIMGISASSIVGGVAAGLIQEEKEVKTNRLKEGFFQFMNASLPTWVVGGGLSLCENSKKYNNNFCKIVSMAVGLLVGMYGSAALSNIICDPKDIHPDRKLNIKDALANIDDALGILVLAKFPLVNKLKINYILPFIYVACGYRAGKSN